MKTEDEIVKDLCKDLEEKQDEIKKEIAYLSENIKIINMLEVADSLRKLPELLDYDFTVNDKIKIISKIDKLNKQLIELERAKAVLKDIYIV